MFLVDIGGIVDHQCLKIVLCYTGNITKKKLYVNVHDGDPIILHNDYVYHVLGFIPTQLNLEINVN